MDFKSNLYICFFFLLYIQFIYYLGLSIIFSISFPEWSHITRRCISSIFYSSWKGNSISSWFFSSHFTPQKNNFICFVSVPDIKSTVVVSTQEW